MDIFNMKDAILLSIVFLLGAFSGFYTNNCPQESYSAFYFCTMYITYLAKRSKFTH